MKGIKNFFMDTPEFFNGLLLPVFKGKPAFGLPTRQPGFPSGLRQQMRERIFKRILEYMVLLQPLKEISNGVDLHQKFNPENVLGSRMSPKMFTLMLKGFLQLYF